MMNELKVATIIFTYNRPKHTSAVLDGLKNNSVKPSSLIIMHDGKKESTNINDWTEVEQIIRDVSWCCCTVESREENWGLANSVIYGVNKVLEEYDAVIVLEDDCVPHKLFMEYMIMALEKYKTESNVFCIGASAEPVEVPQTGYDAYFMGRINSCGWGTWRNKWKFFERDYRLLGKIKNDKELYKWYEVWGQDIEPTVYGDVEGKYDTWAAFWALSVMKYKGLCLAPHYSFIDNIGFDGSGRHSGNEKPVFGLLDKNKKEVLLPDEIKVIDNYERIFANYYPWTNPFVRERYYKEVLLKLIDYEGDGGKFVDLLRRKGLSRICLWGVGDLGSRIIQWIKNEIEVVAIIMTSPGFSEYDGIKCIKADSIPDGIDGIVVIPGYDISRIKKMIPDRNKEQLIPVDELFQRM